MNKSKRSPKVNQILVEYVADREAYYRNKILTGTSIRQAIQLSIRRQELPILKCLIIQEFPQHREFMLKYVMIQP